MAKFKMRLRLQGLEVEIEGERDDAAMITRNLGTQLSGLIKPVGQIVDGAGEGEGTGGVAPRAISAIEAPSRKARRSRRQPSTTSPDTDASVALEVSLAPEKFGVPRQEWKTAEKAVWLIYVLKESGMGDTFATRIIVETFNKHFKQSGTITTSNVTRDLGRLKTKERPAWVGENTTLTPSGWFLTEEGQKRAQALVAAARGPSD